MQRANGDRKRAYATRARWRLKNINAGALYDICDAYATAAKSKRAA
jgi:hypothetical protein